jgi:hypothetical protein
MSEYSEYRVAKYDFKIHPCALIFPELSTDEFNKLKTDIQSHGQLEPVMLSAGGLTLLDGRHRVKACKSLDIPVWVRRFISKDNLTEEDFIWSQNVARRHLTVDQRAMLSQRWADTIREAAKQRQKEHGETAPGKPKITLGENAQSVPRTRTATAKKAGVTEHKVRQAETVKKHAPALVPKVERGEMKLNDAVKHASAPAVAPEAVPYGSSCPICRKPLNPEHLRTHGVSSLKELRDKIAPVLNNARAWLIGVVDEFEEKGFVNVDAEELSNVLPPYQIENLTNCKDWMERILRAQK